MFLIVWSDEAFAQMTGIVGRHTARKSELAGALRRIADELSRNPASVGESRDDDFRIMFARPLTVYFRVDDETTSVEVARVVLTG